MPCSMWSHEVSQVTRVCWCGCDERDLTFRGLKFTHTEQYIPPLLDRVYSLKQEAEDA